MKTIIKYTTILSFFALVSCERFVDLDLPKNQLATESVFLDSVGARGALNGVYVNIMEGMGILSGALSIYPALSADELIYSSSSGEEYEFYLNQLDVNNNYISSFFWANPFKIIYATNAIIEGINESDGIRPSAKETMIAEARLIRGVCYFYMVNLYGEVPVVSSIDYTINRKLERSSIEKVYAFIEEDLIFARDHIDPSVVLNTHASHFAAEALLAKVFLYQEKFSLALEASSNVIASGFSNEQ